MNKYKKAAIITGVSLIVMTITAIFVFGFVQSTLIDNYDGLKTQVNIKSNSGLYLSGMFGLLIIIITDLLVTYNLCQYFKDLDKKLSIISSLFRLIYTIILIIASSRLLVVYLEVNTSTPESILNNTNGFISIWNFGLIIFGLHLIVLGLLANKTKFIHKYFSIMLIVAGLSYTLLNTIYFFPILDSIRTTMEMILMLPMTVGEVGFGIWLLVIGRKIASF